MNGLINFCLCCPRVISKRQRFCPYHRSTRNAWLNRNASSRVLSFGPETLKQVRELDRRVAALAAALTDRQLHQDDCGAAKQDVLGLELAAEQVVDGWTSAVSPHLNTLAACLEPK
ncbi:hypothetical protein [Aeromicrobium sp. Root495]|uniref:hypothetical protein n=1 Tax=Aeromicrobium sp. Root495 TaxID=1736550 RepID=UPI0012E91950|nr:hypothetical protein [Aeromicrobium sp. Root495]